MQAAPPPQRQVNFTRYFRGGPACSRAFSVLWYQYSARRKNGSMVPKRAPIKNGHQMKTVLGIVPVTAPNADAVKIVVEAPELPPLRSWIAASIALAPFVPEGHVLVTYSQDRCGGAAAGAVASIALAPFGGAAAAAAAVALKTQDQINGL